MSWVVVGVAESSREEQRGTERSRAKQRGTERNRGELRGTERIREEQRGTERNRGCLIYTYDAADDQLRVELGGPHILNNTNNTAT